jgi:hypothetical protein
MRQTKCAACISCCPDGGAIFRATWDNNDNKVWKCCNCHAVLPRRNNKTKSDKPTDSQQRTLDLLMARTRGNGIIERSEMIGRDLFISIKDRRSNVFLDEEYVGTIGPRGACKITRYYFGGSQKLTHI